MAKDNPITGPYPDGDSRNITLTKSEHSMEPPRTGPREEGLREVEEEVEPSAEAETKAGTAQGDGKQAKQVDQNKRAPGYEETTKEPSAAETAFGRPGGQLKKPVLKEDWNPAERNSDDLSR